jgi:hypothetical protein
MNISTNNSASSYVGKSRNGGKAWSSRGYLYSCGYEEVWEGIWLYCKSKQTFGCSVGSLFGQGPKNMISWITLPVRARHYISGTRERKARYLTRKMGRLVTPPLNIVLFPCIKGQGTWTFTPTHLDMVRQNYNIFRDRLSRIRENKHRTRLARFSRSSKQDTPGVYQSLSRYYNTDLLTEEIKFDSWLWPIVCSRMGWEQPLMAYGYKVCFQELAWGTMTLHSVFRGSCKERFSASVLNFQPLCR